MKQLELSLKIIDKTEAPNGFYAFPKDFVETPNVCNICDAKQLCQENKDDWCLNNRCMSYSRKDGVGVVFKKNN